MTEDWFVAAVEPVADTGREACLAIETAVGALRRGGEARNAGQAIVDVLDELIGAAGREIRLSAADAFREYERAIFSMRAGFVRELVDEDLSLTNARKHVRSHGKRLPGSTSRCRVGRRSLLRRSQCPCWHLRSAYRRFIHDG
jgi:hypothetical protein